MFYFADKTYCWQSKKLIAQTLCHRQKEKWKTNKNTIENVNASKRSFMCWCICVNISNNLLLSLGRFMMMKQKREDTCWWLCYLSVLYLFFFYSFFHTIPRKWKPWQPLQWIRVKQFVFICFVLFFFLA